MREDQQPADAGGIRQFSITLPSALVTEIDAVAAAQHISRNAVVRQLIDLGMEQRRRERAAIEAVA